MSGVSYFTAVIGRGGAGWRALDVDVEDVESLDELAGLLRPASRAGEPVLAVLEREDAWFAIVRVDGDDDCRAFVSDLEATEHSHYADLLAPVGDLELDEYADLRTPAAGSAIGAATGSLDDPLDEEDDWVGDGQSPLRAGSAPVREGSSSGARDEVDALVADTDGDLALAAIEPEVVPTWAGDPGLLADVGVPPRELVDLVLSSPGDPASVVADVGERCGFDELLDALR